MNINNIYFSFYMLINEPGKLIFISNIIMYYTNKKKLIIKIRKKGYKRLGSKRAY